MIESINTYLTDNLGISIAASIFITLLVIGVVERIISKFKGE